MDTKDAVGCVLCHDLTRIVKDQFKDAQFRKGHIVTAEDIPMLLSMGKDHLYVWEMQEGMVHENDAAKRLCALCRGEGMEQSGVKEGKIELTASFDGLFRVDTEKLDAINDINDIIIATRHNNSPVQKGDGLCGTRVIPLVIEEEKLRQAEEIAGGKPILELLPYKLKTTGVVTTGNEVFYGRVENTFTPVIVDKLRQYGIEMTEHLITDDNTEHITEAIAKMRDQKVDLILCTGGMSVDPDDNTPGAIRKSGAEIVTYGAPVLPGAMFLLGYYPDGVPVMGLPACVMYAGATVFDMILPRVAAGVRVTKKEISGMGNGGLCLRCTPCHYPLCPFGK